MESTKDILCLLRHHPEVCPDCAIPFQLHHCFGEVFERTFSQLININSVGPSCRLFYLFQDVITKYVHEETLFNFLSKLVPSSAILILAAIMGEYQSFNSPLFHSCCTKTPTEWERLANIASILTGLTLVMTFMGLGLQITILVKLKQVESKPTNDPWVISYDITEGVNIVKLPPLESTCKIWKHRRNLVSPLGSCISFVVCQIWMLVIAYHYIFNLSPTGPPVAHDFLVFMAPSRDFFLLNLIETVCSPTLRSSLFEMIQFGLC